MVESDTSVRVLYFCDYCGKMVRPPGAAGTVVEDGGRRCAACVSLGPARSAAAAPAAEVAAAASSSQRLRAQAVPLSPEQARARRRKWALMGGGAAAVCVLLGLVLYFALRAPARKPDETRRPEPVVHISLLVGPGPGQNQAVSPAPPGGNEPASREFFPKPPTENLPPPENHPPPPENHPSPLPPGGADNSRPPVENRAPPPDPAIEARKAVEEKFAAAQAYAKEHPAEIEKTLQLLHEARDAGAALAPDDAVLVKVLDAAKPLEKRIQEANQKQWEDLRRLARKAADDGDYDTALILLTKPAAPFDKLLKDDKDTAALAAAQATALRAEVDTRYKEAFDEANKALVGPDPAKALEALDKLKDLRYEPQRKVLANLRETIQKRGRDVESAAAKERQTKTRDSLYDLMEKQAGTADMADFADALKAAREGPDAEALKADLSVMQALRDGCAARARCARDEVAASKGRQLELQTTGGKKEHGTLAEVTEELITLQTPIVINGETTGQASTKVPWSTLTAGQLEALAKQWKPEPGVRAILRALAVLRDPGAQKNVKSLNDLEKELAAAKSSPVAEHLRQKIQSRAAEQADLGAQEAWKKLAQALRGELDASRAKALIPKVEQYLAEYGRTHFAQEHALSVLSSLRRACCQNYVKNGGFETGQLAPWQVEAPVDSKVQGDKDAHDGRFAYWMHSSPKLTEELNLAPNKDYVLSFWIKVLEGGNELHVLYLEPGKNEGPIAVKPDIRNKGEWVQTVLFFRAPQPKGTLCFSGNNANLLLDGIAVNSVDDQAKLASAPFDHVALPKPAARERVLLGPNAEQTAKVVEGWETVTECPGGPPGFDGSSRLLVTSTNSLGKARLATVILTYTATAPMGLKLEGAMKSSFVPGGAMETLPAGKVVTAERKVPGRWKETEFDALRLEFNSPPPGTFWLHRVTVKE